MSNALSSMLDELVGDIEALKAIMVDVATGTNISRRENEYKPRYMKAASIFERLQDQGIGVGNPNSFPSLWDFHGYWGEKLPTYRERRKFVSGLYRDSLEKLKMGLMRSKDEGWDEGRLAEDLRRRFRQEAEETSQGARADATKDRYVEKGLVVVLMPIDKANRVLEDTFSTICEVVKERGLSVWRSDLPRTSDNIVKEVLDAIDRAEFIVADLTNERPSVYYEVGYAHGKGIGVGDIILIAFQETRLHFDLRNSRTHFYSNQTELKGALRGLLVRTATS